MNTVMRPLALSLATAALALLLPSAAAAWEPTKPIEFVIPAGTGGGADQMARLIAGIAEKHNLTPRPMVVVNKSGGAGAEGFLHVKGKKGDDHTLIITLSTSNCRTMRQRLAPIAVRIDVSRVRRTARASSRFATLAQAIKSTKQTAPSSE